MRSRDQRRTSRRRRGVEEPLAMANESPTTSPQVTQYVGRGEDCIRRPYDCHCDRGYRLRRREYLP
jgi:hypothetical protein